MWRGTLVSKSLIRDRVYSIVRRHDRYDGIMRPKTRRGGKWPAFYLSRSFFFFSFVNRDYAKLVPDGKRGFREWISDLYVCRANCFPRYFHIFSRAAKWINQYEICIFAMQLSRSWRFKARVEVSEATRWVVESRSWTGEINCQLRVTRLRQSMHACVFGGLHNSSYLLSSNCFVTLWKAKRDCCSINTDGHARYVYNLFCFVNWFYA